MTRALPKEAVEGVREIAFETLWAQVADFESGLERGVPVVVQMQISSPQ